MIETTENKRVYTVGTSPAFAFDLSFFAAEEIRCYVSQGEKAVELQRGVDFFVERKAGYEGGATVTLSEQPTQNLPTGLPTGATLAIVREVKLTQELSLPRYGKLPSEELEKQLDKFAMQTQQLAEQLTRALLLDPTQDFDQEDMAEQFSTLVNNAERWAKEARSGAATAKADAAKAKSSADEAYLSKLTAAEAAAKAGKSEAETGSMRGEVARMYDDSSLNRAHLVFGEWGDARRNVYQLRGLDRHGDTDRSGGGAGGAQCGRIGASGLCEEDGSRKRAELGGVGSADARGVRDGVRGERNGSRRVVRLRRA